jgi:integrase/recombinase XerD
MTSDTSPRPISPLRARMIEDMTVRGFKDDTRRDYVRQVRAFAAFIGRSPDTATAEELRLFQLHQTQSGLQPPTINSAVSALRFFFTVTLDRPDLARRLTVVPYPRRIPTVLSVEEVRLSVWISEHVHLGISIGTGVALALVCWSLYPRFKKE